MPYILVDTEISDEEAAKIFSVKVVLLLLLLLTFSVTFLLTYSMEQSPSWEANRISASQKFYRI